MTQSDEAFFRLLYKQLEEQREDRNLTTIRALEKRAKNNNNNKTNTKKQKPTGK
jgi:hypothetical protein